MLHCKTANLVKVGTVLVTLLASTYVNAGITLDLGGVLDGDDGGKSLFSRSTLPVFVDRAAGDNHFRTVLSAGTQFPQLVSLQETGDATPTADVQPAENTTTPSDSTATTDSQNNANNTQVTVHADEAATHKTKHYNILSIDGGGIRGIIPTMVIQYIETESYKYAVSRGLIEEYAPGEKKIIHMNKLFDMIAGTSTGGLITTSLVTPSIYDNTKAYDSDFILSIFEEKGQEIFKTKTINKGLLGIMITTFIMIGGVLGYKWGKSIFANPQVEDTNYKLRQYIKELKRTAKRAEDAKDTEKPTPLVQNLLMNQLHQAIHQKLEIHYELIQDGAQIEQLIESHDYWKIKEGERLLQEREGKYRESKQKKWIICVMGLILGGFLGYYIPITVYYLGNSNYNRAVIDGYLKQFFGHAKAHDILTDECLIVSYSYNAHEPRFYSKYEAKKNPGIYNVTLDIAAGGSSAAPGYFDPKVFENGRGETEVLVDGGIIANNPSMYAFIFASEMNKKENVRVVSIGTGQVKQPTIDPNNVNILTWVQNLGDLIIDVEVTAHAYFTQFLADKYARYQIQTELPLDAADGESVKALKELGIQLVNEQKESIDRLIHNLVEERFGRNQ